MSETPKPRTEVIEETRETLAVLELDRTPRPEKMRREREYFDGAHEVRFTERSFKPRRAAGLDEIRSFVDSLEVKRRPVAPLPEPAPVATPVVPAKIPEHYRAPLEAVIRGGLISVETVHRIGTGTVVDVLWESEDEGERRGLYLVQDGRARPYSDVARDIDELPVPETPASAAPESEPAPGSPAPLAAEPTKRRFGFGRSKGADAPPPSAPAEAEDKPKKRRFGFKK